MIEDSFIKMMGLMRRLMWTPIRVRKSLKGAPALALVLTLALSGMAKSQDSPVEFQALVAHASAARDAGDIPQAISLYQEAVAANPSWPDGWWYLGSMQYGTNAYEPAIRALSHYIELTPTAGPALALRGLCEFEVGQYADSLKDLQHGIALGAATQPRNAGIILYHEAILLTKTGNFEAALGKYGEMAKHGDVNQDVMTAIGLAGLRLPVLPTEIEPTQAQLVLATGQAGAAFLSGDATSADQAFQNLFHLYPEAANVHYFYGYLLFSKDSDRAIDQFQAELTVSPLSAETRSMLAWAYSLRSDYAASLPVARQAVEENPNLLLAQLVLGRALMETGDVDGGVQHLLLVLGADAQNLDAHLALAKAYSKLGRREDARKERLECLAITGQGAVANASM